MLEVQNLNAALTILTDYIGRLRDVIDSSVNPVTVAEAAGFVDEIDALNILILEDMRSDFPSGEKVARLESVDKSRDLIKRIEASGYI